MPRVYALACLVVAVFAVVASMAAGAARADKDAVRAVRAYRVLERVYFDRRSGDYRERAHGQAGSHAWPFSQALAATIAVARLGDARSAARSAVPARFRVLDRRFRVHGVYRADPGGDVYYDDNEWIAQDLLDWDSVRRSPSARRKAERIFRAVVAAWDGDPQTPCAGGVQWTDAPANDDRNTVSTANGAVLGLRLYLLTRRAEYLRWAQRMVAWPEQCLLDPDGLYADHVRGDGTVDRTEWSYNQGSMLEAYRLLYRATGNQEDLARAEAIADATVAEFRGRWSSEPPQFAAIFFRRLLDLAADDGRSDYVAAAQRYADRLWRTAPRLLFGQAALVQMYAALAAARGGA